MDSNKKRIIWSNIDTGNFEDWKNNLIENYKTNGIAINPTDNEVFDYIDETNQMNLETEMDLLYKQLPGRVLAIADIGRWNGRVTGYKVLSCNLNSIFNIADEYCEFYFDDKNVYARIEHHDGTNFIMFREIKEDKNIDRLLDAIYNNEEISIQKLSSYTKSLVGYIKNIYG